MQAALKALAAAAALRARFAGSARACTAYVTNERNNTVSVVDLDQIKDGQGGPGRPAPARHHDLDIEFEDKR